jgi:hypothetical protein
VSTVFISYRRETAAGEARALFNDLVGRLGKSAVFMDVDSIALGRDFRNVLQKTLGSCDLMLVIIDKDWAGFKDVGGRTRLGDPNDFVRMEVEAALKRDIVVTPVLVKGAQMPAAEQLPSEIRDLVYRNGFELSHSRWESDLREMIRRLGLDLPERGRQIETGHRPIAPEEATGRSIPIRQAESKQRHIWVLVSALIIAASSLGSFLLYRYGRDLVVSLPEPSNFAVGGKVLDKASNAPVANATVEANDDATSGKPSNLVYTDDRGFFYLNYGKDDEGRYVRVKVLKEKYAASTLHTLIRAHSDTLAFALSKEGVETPPGASRSGAALDFSPLNSGQLVAWLSARPENYSSDIRASFSKDFPAGKLIEREMPREGFATQVQSKPSNEPTPDLAFIDNITQLKPLLDAKTVWLVKGSPRFPTRGWWVIFKDTKHLDQAQTFVRWLIRAPGWQPRAKNISISTAAIQAVQNAAIAALHDVMSGDQAGLESLLDKNAARSRPKPVDPNAQVSDVQPVLTFGNSRIAFVLLAVITTGDDFYEMTHRIFVFRNQGASWRILQMQTNVKLPAVESLESLESIEANLELLRAFDDRIVTDRPEPSPPAAMLVDPPDRATLPRFPDRPDIAWGSDASADADFIVESQFANTGDEANWSESYLHFAEVSRGAQPFKQRAPFGVGMQPHRWRIWTLGRSGAVSLSPWRTLLYSN